jgi:hypothetical protein
MNSFIPERIADLPDNVATKLPRRADGRTRSLPGSYPEAGSGCELAARFQGIRGKADALHSGAIVTVTDDAIRIRRLPVVRIS